MKSTQQKVTLQKPCPVAMSSLKGVNRNFYCNSCSKTVVDFRGQSFNEIRSKSNGETCGVFDENQVAPIQFSKSRKVLFTALTLASLIGFNITPVRADTSSNHINSVNLVSSSLDKDKKKEKEAKKKKKRWNPFRKKKKIFTPVGCPSF